MEDILKLDNSINIEIFAYVLSVIGTLGDHISTMIGLTKDGIYESNPFVRQLISNGLWLPVDLAVVILGIVIPFLLIRSFRHPSLRGLIAYPLVFGLIRLGACLWNFTLII